MKILVVAATALEVRKLTQGTIEVGNPHKLDLSLNHRVDVLVTGVGAVPTAVYLSRFADEYDFVLNIGIAGSYNRNIELGQVVVIDSDALGDYGIDNNGSFVSLMNAGLLDSASCLNVNSLANPWVNKIIHSAKYARVKGLTLGTASGSNIVIDKLKDYWGTDVETMESAAVFYTCILLNKPFLCLRAISNFVEPRDTSKWRIGEALDNLHSETLNLIASMDVKYFRKN